MIEYVLIAILFFAVGILVGYFITKRNFPVSIGKLNIDVSDADGSRYFFLEIDKGKMDFIIPGRTISMKVIERSYLDSHE